MQHIYFLALFIILFAGLGITAGAHRLWAHAAFEASGFIRGLLMMAHTVAGVVSAVLVDFVLEIKLILLIRNHCNLFINIFLLF